MDVIETAAWWAIEQPGWVERVFERHVSDDGRCTGCGSYRPVPWPCVLVVIARRAQELIELGRAQRGGVGERPAPRRPAPMRPRVPGQRVTPGAA
ncbi:hypothetical protein [Pseudonocardia acaciae]|uniref:hypothetical protein n=1 Tax=Pseudonocardia acaciae TaxID=551276 RepID=UPI00048CC275|nr:hypothetical protein [Pseudonocardia acaciae]